MFLWIIPIPPSCAKAIAKRASVTVSIAAERIGILSVIPRVNFVWRETSLGNTVECAGTSKTSSNVKASCSNRIFSVLVVEKAPYYKVCSTFYHLIDNFLTLYAR